MTKNSILKKIRLLKKMTPSEIKIAEYFSQNEAELVFENATTISNSTGVSKATVVRFISKLGYKKFGEFTTALRDELVYGQESLPIRYSLKRKHLKNRKEDILGDNFSYIMKNIQNTHARIDPDKFLDVARLLMKQDAHLYITGQRTSYPLAHLFHMLISRIRPDSTLLGPEISMMPDRLSSVCADDILLSIFRHPYGKQTQKISKYFAEKNANIILITDSEFSPISKLATDQIVVPSEGLSIFNSFTAVTALLESLNIAALKFCTEDIIDRLEIGEKLLGDFDVFCPTKGLDLSQIKKLKGMQSSRE